MHLSTAVFCLLVVWVGSLYGSPLRHIVLHNQVIQTHQVAPTVHSDMHGSQDLQWMVHVSNVFSSQEKSELNRAISPYEFGVYLPHNTYLLVAPRDVIKKVEKHPSVLWVGAFLPEYKLSKNFEQSAANAKKPVLVVLLPPQSPETKNKRTNEQAQAIAEDWVSRFSMSGVSISARANRGDKIIVQVTPIEKLHEVGVWLSQQPESHFIEVTRPQKFNNLYAGNAVKTGSMDSTPVLSYINSQLNGSSQIIGIADSGLDFASCYFSDGRGANDTTVFDRKVVRYATYPGAGDRLDADGHGTFVAGTILGSTTSSPQNNSNGIAPAAKVYFWDISANGVEFSDTENFRSNVLDYYDETLGDLNEDINTWLFTFGSPVEWYSTFSADIDGFMHEYPDYVVVVPAGNDGQSLIEAALSKNAIVVGASQSFPETLSNPLSSTGGPIDTSNAALWGTQALASFSAKGPTPDGRLKPDIVAPGQRITSSLNGVSCATEVRQGTSYAAAVAAGAAAIVRDYFVKAFYPSGLPGSDPPLYTIPSAALVKAMLINSGQTLLVGDADGQGHFVSLANAWPSSFQGYGRIQLDQVLYFQSSTFNMSALADDVPPLQQGDTYRTCFFVYPGSSTVKITLVWTDPPGSPTAGISLINDLDVVLYDQRGNTWKATTGNGEFDTINNVEQIYVPNLPPGMYSISFHGARVTTAGGQAWVAVATANNADLTSSASFCTFNFDNSTHPVCANGCSGHGTCTSTSLGFGQFLSYCACNAGFSGVDCSKSSCIANCNGNGVCDYITSTCSCNLNYDPADGCVTLLPDVVVPPTPPPLVIVQSASDPLPYYIGIGVAAFVFGALVLGVAGFFGAVKYLEYRRDKAAMSKNTEMKS